MIKKTLFLMLCVSLILSPLAQTQQLQNHNDTLEQLSSHDIKTLTEKAEEITNSLSDEEKELLKKTAREIDIASYDLTLRDFMTPIHITATVVIFLFTLVVVLNQEKKERRT